MLSINFAHEQHKSFPRLNCTTPAATANDTHHEIPSGKMVIQGTDRIYVVGDRKYLVLDYIEGNQKCEEVKSGKIVMLKFIDYDHELGADYDTIELNGKLQTDSKNLHSQYILYFLDAFELIIRDQQKLCLVSEYFEKNSLRSWRESINNVSLSVVLQVLFQGLCALDALHHGSFVHVDVKEDNFFVKSFDDKLIKIVLGDLGLSFKLQGAEKAVAKDLSSSVDSLCSVTKNTGTEGYRDPLIIEKHKICFASDLWSLGITLLKFIFYDKDSKKNLEKKTEMKRYKHIDKKFSEVFQNKPEWQIIKEIIKGLLIENIDERWTINKVLGKIFLVKSQYQLTFVNTLGFEYNYSILRDEFRHEESVIITVLSHDGLNLRHVPKKHHSNKKIIMEAIHSNPAAYNLILGELKSDINIQKEVIKGDVTLMEYIPQKYNHEIQKLQLEVNQSKQTYSNSKITPSKQECNDKKFVLEKVKCDGLFLKYVSENLKDDIEVVNTSLHQDGLSLQFVAEKLKNQKSIALKAIYQNPLALEYVSNDLKNDKEIVEYAVKRKGSAIKFASKSLRTDRKLIEMAAEADFTGELFSLLPELKKDDLRILASLNEQLFLNFIFKYGEEFSSGRSSVDLCFNGMIYYFVKLDAPRAFTLFREASLKGNSHAQYYLGRMYYHGDAVIKDLTEAKEWFKKSAEQGHVLSQHNVAAMESQGKPNELFLEPAKCGYSYSQYALGLYYYNNKLWKESFYWFKKSAEQGILTVSFGANVKPVIQQHVKQWIDTLPMNQLTGKSVQLVIGNSACINSKELSSLGEDSYILRIVNNESLVICTDGNLPNGVSYGVYAILQEVFGFGFLHPLKVHLSPLIDMANKNGQLNLEETLRKYGRLDSIQAVNTPFLSRRGIHIHSEHPLELTNFLNGFSTSGGLNYKDKNEWKKGLSEWQQFCEWMIANKQTSVEWVLLYADSWMEFADSIERQERLTEIVNLAHLWGVEVGLDVPIAMEQQHAWRLIRKYGNVKEEIQDLHQHIDYVMKAGFDFMATELGFSEFTHGDPNKMVLWLNESAIYLDQKYGKTIYAKVHVSKGQTVNSYIDPLTHKPGCNFNFLPYYADSRLGIMPHTVQMFSMDDPAYTYGNVNFTDIRDFMYLELGKRKIIFHPETAYWVTFDINVPLFLPVYPHRRFADIRNIAKETAKRGIPIDGQMIFSSGWEYGYWLSDVLTGRMAWNPHLNIPDETQAFFALIDQITKSFIFDKNARSSFNQILFNQMQEQKAYLVDGLVNGKAPSSQLLRAGIDYLTGWDTWSDLNDFVESVANVQTETQPKKLQFYQVSSKGDNGMYENAVRPLIFEMTNQFNLTHIKYVNFLNQYLSVLFGGELELLNELADCTLLVALRSKLSLRLFEYSLLKSQRLPYEPETPAMIYQRTDALQTIQQAQKVVDTRILNFRLDSNRSMSWGANPTAYSYGYLWHSKKLFFWWRDYAKAILNIHNPCFMNEDNPADIALGDGFPQIIAQILKDILEKMKYLDWVEECFAVNVKKEPNVPPFTP